jgi:AraC-like DNA-binding protein
MKAIFDLLFILNGTLGLICFVLVLFSLKKNKVVNVYLALIILAVSTRFIFKGITELSHNIDLLTTFFRNDVSLMALPLPYLYFRNLALRKSIFKTTYLFHFLLPVLVTIEMNYHLFEGLCQVEFTFLVKSVIISIVAYNIVMITILLMKSFWRKTSVIEFKTEHETLLKKWSIVFYFAFLVTASKIVCDQLLFQDNLHISENFFTWISWLIVFIMILTSPSILNIYLSQISREGKVTSSAISNWQLKSTIKISNKQDLLLSQKINSELDVYFHQIDQFIEKEHFFRQSGLSVNDLAFKLKIPKSHLSFIFKYHSSISFSDFKKLIRIQDAIALIDEGYLKTNTFDSLSNEVGFSTYNSFYIGFKEVTSKAPQEYVTGLNEYGLK